VTLGFVLSMVFGHTLIIFPSVIGMKLRYSPVLYLPLLLLQISVAIRIVGDFSGSTELRSLSGSLTVAAVALFAVTIASVSGRSRTPADDGTSHLKGVGAN